MLKLFAGYTPMHGGRLLYTSLTFWLARPSCLRCSGMRAGGGFADLLHGGQQQANQNSDDCDHHEQFDQREAAEG